MKICMAVISDMTYDARVHREAKALVDAGHEVVVISTTTGTTTLRYIQDGIRITALPVDVANRRGVLHLFRSMVTEMRVERAEVYHAHNVHTLPFAWWVARRCGSS